MKTVKIILDFLTTVVRLFFRSRGKGKPCKPLADGAGHPVHLPQEHRSSPGSHRSDTLTIQTNTPSTPLNMLGWGLIISAAGGYLLKILG